MCWGWAMVKREKKGYLAGDIGGTKTLLGLFTWEEESIVFVEKKRFPSQAYLKLADIIDEFLDACDCTVSNDGACFGIAGPCSGGICTTRNLPWVVDAGEIKDRFGFKQVSLINDFEAMVHGILELPAKDFEVLNPGSRDLCGNIAVLGAGTGLGEAFGIYDSALGRYRVYASEGGHASFSPSNDEEIAILQFLKQQYRHVSFERVLSGNGLVNIYRYLLSTGDYDLSGAFNEEMGDTEDPAATISKFGLTGQLAICGKALDIFMSIYGCEAGNLALKILPTGGVYLTGGIAVKLQKKLMDGLFMKSFLSKGRSEAVLRNIPVQMVGNPEVGLLGAAAKVIQGKS